MTFFLFKKNKLQLGKVVADMALGAFCAIQFVHSKLKKNEKQKKQKQTNLKSNFWSSCFQRISNAFFSYFLNSPDA